MDDEDKKRDQEIEESDERERKEWEYRRYLDYIQEIR